MDSRWLDGEGQRLVPLKDLEVKMVNLFLKCGFEFLQ